MWDAWLEDQQISHVSAGPCNHRIGVGGGRTIRADQLPRWAWQRISRGLGSKGDRTYDWALADANPPPESAAAPAGGDALPAADGPPSLGTGWSCEDDH